MSGCWGPIINSLGCGKFKGFSAGSQPSGEIHPFALDLLKRLNYDTSNLSSKSWEEFASADVQPLNFVFTVCEDAAKETCPIWPGQPMTVHWSLPDRPCVYKYVLRNSAAGRGAISTGGDYWRGAGALRCPAVIGPTYAQQRRIRKLGVCRFHSWSRPPNSRA